MISQHEIVWSISTGIPFSAHHFEVGWQGQLLVLRMSLFKLENPGLPHHNPNEQIDWKCEPNCHAAVGISWYIR